PREPVHERYASPHAFVDVHFGLYRTGIPAMVAADPGPITRTGTPWPTEIRLRKDRRALTIAFDDGASYVLPAEYLRVRSPSAEVQGHTPEQRKIVPGKKYVEILEIQPVGNYAVRLVFDDLHSTGIFSWDYLFDLGRNHDAYWRDYLDELAARGLTREKM